MSAAREDSTIVLGSPPTRIMVSKNETETLVLVLMREDGARIERASEEARAAMAATILAERRWQVRPVTAAYAAKLRRYYAR